MRAIAGIKVGKCKVSVRVGKYKLGARGGKYKLGARSGKNKFRARDRKYKLETRAGVRSQSPGTEPGSKKKALGQEIQRPVVK